MPVIIHSGRCDQAEECTCPEVCPTGAWMWKEDHWEIDNSKCISCGLCVKECPAEAVLLAKTYKELQQIREQIKRDREHTPEKLFVERYGGVPVNESTEDINKLKKANKLLLEFFIEDSIHCLVKCVPYNKFARCIPLLKVNAESRKELAKRYAVVNFPTLILLEDGKELGRIEGFTNSEKKLKRFITKFLDNTS